MEERYSRFKAIQNWLQSVDSRPRCGAGTTTLAIFVGLEKHIWLGLIRDQDRALQILTNATARAAWKNPNELQRDFNAGFGKMEVGSAPKSQDQGLLELCLEFTQKG